LDFGLFFGERLRVTDSDGGDYRLPQYRRKMKAKLLAMAQFFLSARFSIKKRLFVFEK
jgi:hypothetical protein